MNKLVHVDVSKIIEGVIPVLESREEVVGAYLFGSILGACRPDSDIDIGLLLNPDISYSEKELERIQEEVLEELPAQNNRVFDLVILNNYSDIFKYKVITEGKLIYARDQDIITDFIEIVSRRRAENYPRYREALEIIARGE